MGVHCASWESATRSEAPTLLRRSEPPRLDLAACTPLGLVRGKAVGNRLSRRDNQVEATSRSRSRRLRLGHAPLSARSGVASRNDGTPSEFDWFCARSTQGSRLTATAGLEDAIPLGQHQYD